MTSANVDIYTAGTLVRCRASFTNRPLTDWEAGQFQIGGVLPAGTGADPPSVSCTAKRPDGTEVTVPTSRDGAGAYHADVDTTGFTGQWYVRLWSAAGQVNQGAGETTFFTEGNV